MGLVVLIRWELLTTGLGYPVWFDTARPNGFSLSIHPEPVPKGRPTATDGNPVTIQ